MKKTLTVSKYTFIDVYRSKVMASLFFIALGLLLLTYVASEFAYGAPAKIALDFGFGITSIVNLMMSIFIGANLLNKEIEQKTLYMILSRTISRTEFLLGKIIGLSSVLIINSILLSILSIGIYRYLGGEIQGLMFWAILFAFLESFIVLLFAILFSLITNTTLSVIYSIGIYIVGHALNETSKSFFIKVNVLFKYMLDASFFFVPNFYKLNLKDFLIYKQNIGAEYLISVTAYSLFYIAALLILVSVVFNRKNLD